MKIDLYDLLQQASTKAPVLDQRCFIIAEVAQAHDGSLGQAHAFIDAIARTGADAVKFQTHIAAAESTPEEPWRVKFSPQDATRYDYWKRMEFTEDQWAGLRSHAEQQNLLFLSSPFSVEAVRLLERLGVPAWKVASGEVTNRAMLDAMGRTRLPIILSTGMSPLWEIDAAVANIREYGVPLCLLQCTTAYPCPPERVGLNMIPVFRERYGCAVGLSDHSGTIFPGLAAATLGISVLEVHITLSREMFGPDVVASLLPGELKQLVDGVRFIEKMKSAQVNKDLLADELKPLKSIFTRSIVARTDLPEGTILREEHLTLKKPGTGLPAERLTEVLGSRLRHAVRENVLLREEDLEAVES